MRFRALRRLQPTLSAALLAFLTGCASVNPVALARLASFDPLSADPAAISVAVVAPKSIRLRDGDATLKLALDAANPKWRFDETIELEVAVLAGAEGIAHDPARETLTMARIGEADLARMRAAQQKALAHKATGEGKGKGSISVGVGGGCTIAPLPEGPLAVSIYMRTDPAGDYFQLVGGQDLRKLAGGKLVDNIKPCEPSAH